MPIRIESKWANEWKDVVQVYLDYNEMNSKKTFKEQNKEKKVCIDAYGSVIMWTTATMNFIRDKLFCCNKKSIFFLSSSNSQE